MSDKEERTLGSGVSRRQFLKVAGVAGATIGVGAGLSGVLAACGEAEETTTTAAGATTTTAAGATTTTAAAGSTTTVSAGAEVGREVKIGFVTPQTGGLASFGVPDKYCVERAQEAIGDGIVCGDGLKHPVTIITKDSQSDGARAAQVTGDLINNDKVDIVTAASTPDTVNPVADQAEAGGTPCVTNDCPWQPYVGGRSAGDLNAVFKWTYHTFWGLEDVQATFLDMWSQVPNNKVVGAMFPNDADGNAWLPGWEPVYQPAGLTAVVPSQYQVGHRGLHRPDLRVQEGRLPRSAWASSSRRISPTSGSRPSSRGGSPSWPPTPRPCYSRSRWKRWAILPTTSPPRSGGLPATRSPRRCWVRPASSSPTSSPPPTTAPSGLSPCSTSSSSRWRWTPSSGRPAWTTRKPSSRLSRRTKLDTIGGPIDFTAPVVGATPPFQVGPCHIVENVYKTPLVGGQWRTGTKYPFELTIVSTAAARTLASRCRTRCKSYV